MAEYYKMPTLGQTMEEGTIVQWFKKEGESVKQGELLLEVMSDKASIEVESPFEGVLRKILVGVDGVAPVNTPIAIYGTADEPIDALLDGGSAAVAPGAAVPAAAAPAPAAPAGGQAAAAAAPPAPVAAGPVNASPRARRLADERGVPIAALAGQGTGPGGRIVERDVLRYLESPVAAGQEAPRATPLAARIAEDLGVSLETVAAGQPGARITADDVRRAAAPAAAAAPEPAGEESLLPRVAEVIPFRGIRKMVADNVTRSRFTAPHVTLVMEVDMSAIKEIHARLAPQVQEVYSTKLTITDVLIKAVASVLGKHPLCNAALVGDEIRLYQDLNIGVAVGTDHGLIVPVLRNADRRPLGQLSVDLKALVERCRTGKQTPEDLAGGTFTITNLGMFGIDFFDPILVPPQSCILGVGRIVEKPVVANGQVVPRPMMSLSLSFDHRVLDGVPAARFLQGLNEVLQNPWRMFV
jgi:pyruvate dehydrogenase E2 component (dihydrolipoamide acetyltransferase)